MDSSSKSGPVKRKSTQALARYRRSTAAKKRKDEDSQDIAVAHHNEDNATIEDDSVEEESNKEERTTVTTDLETSDLTVNDEENSELKEACQLLKKENSLLKSLTLSKESLKNDAKVKFYTGLPSFATFMAIFKYVAAPVTSRSCNTLTKFQQFLMVIIKLPHVEHVCEFSIFVNYQISTYRSVTFQAEVFIACDLHEKRSTSTETSRVITSSYRCQIINCENL